MICSGFSLIAVSNQCLCACLFLCVSDDEDDKKLTKAEVALVALGPCTVVALVVIFVAWRWRKKTRKHKEYDNV